MINSAIKRGNDDRVEYLLRTLDRLNIGRPKREPNSVKYEQVK